MKVLLKFLKPYKKESILGPFFKFVEACFDLAIPIITSLIIDNGIPALKAGGGYGYIIKMGLIMIGLGIMGLLCSLTAQYFAAKAAIGFSTDMRADLFRHILKIKHSDADRVGTPALVTRMTADVNKVQIGINYFLRLVLRTPFIIFGAIVMALYISRKVSIVMTAAVIGVIGVVFAAMAAAVYFNRRIQVKNDKTSRLVRENLVGVRVIRAFVRQEKEKEDFNDNSEQLAVLQTKSGRTSAMVGPLNTVIVNGAVIIILALCRVDFGGKLLTQGDIIALINYLNQIFVAMAAMANLVITMSAGIASAERIEQIFEIPEEKIPTDRDGFAEETENGSDKDIAVSFKNVSFSYHGKGAKSLENISFDLKKGEALGIIGGTGSGKSTVTKLIQRFYEPTQGEIFIFGKKLNTYENKKIRTVVSGALQKSILFSGTIRENLSVGLANNSKYNIDELSEEQKEALMMRALEIAQAKEFVSEKPGGLDYVLEAGGKNVSGGQRQRLCVARAVIAEPDILILDDSSSALDFATDAALRKAIRRELRDTSLIIVSQRTTGISFCNQILVLDEGASAGLGTHAELLEECPLYREIHTSQIDSGEEAVS